MTAAGGSVEQAANQMTFLFAYYDLPNARTPMGYQHDIPADVDVTFFPLNLHGREKTPTWNQIQRLWEQRDYYLLSMYDELLEACSTCDALITNRPYVLHPEFIPRIPVFSVSYCVDDPESSGFTTEPVAAFYDGAVYGNIAAQFQYEQWGCKRHTFLPLPVYSPQIPPREEAENVLNSDRTVDFSLVCERECDWRHQRIETLVRAFPQAQCYGPGWPSGKISDNGLSELYLKTKIGWNIHNSTGPINHRMFLLPAHGIMQICDNKVGLPAFFQPGKEVIGFDTMAEGIELSRYYLAHEDERRAIAEQGYNRFWRDYAPGTFWTKMATLVTDWKSEAKKEPEFKPFRPHILAAKGRKALGRAKRLSSETLDVWKRMGTIPPKHEPRYVVDESWPLRSLDTQALSFEDLESKYLFKFTAFDCAALGALQWFFASKALDFHRGTYMGPDSKRFLNFIHGNPFPTCEKQRLISEQRQFSLPIEEWASSRDRALPRQDSAVFVVSEHANIQKHVETIAQSTTGKSPIFWGFSIIFDHSPATKDVIRVLQAVERYLADIYSADVQTWQFKGPDIPWPETPGSPDRKITFICFTNAH